MSSQSAAARMSIQATTAAIVGLGSDCRHCCSFYAARTRSDSLVVLGLALLAVRLKTSGAATACSARRATNLPFQEEVGSP